MEIQQDVHVRQGHCRAHIASGLGLLLVEFEEYSTSHRNCTGSMRIHETKVLLRRKDFAITDILLLPTFMSRDSSLPARFSGLLSPER